MVKSILLAIVFQSLTIAVHSFIITYSTPQQCGDVEISWTRPSTSAAQLQFPLLLHVLPFDSTPISQQIPGWNASMTSGSAVVNLNLNLSSGTGLLLAVTDQIAKPVGRASEVKNVATSQDTSCLSTNTPSSPGHFQTFTTASPSDCPSLAVTWDGSVKSSRPTILGFSPGESPVNMDPPSSPLPIERSVLIKGTFTSMSRVVVLFRDTDSSEPSRTSQFLTVGGTDQDGCSTRPSVSLMSVLASPSPTNPSTLPPCGLQCSNISAGRVIGSVFAGAFCFAALLFAIFTCCRLRHRAAHEPPSDSEKVLSAKSIALSSSPSPPPKPTVSDDNRPVSLSIPRTSTRCEGPSNETEGQQAQEQENKSDTTATPSSISLPHSFPVPPPSLPATPLARRRSWTSRSLTTEESLFLQFTEGSIFRLSLPKETRGAPPTMQDGEGSAVSRPDSPTLPESKSRRASATASPGTGPGPGPGLPSNPRTPKPPKIPKPARPRSQRSQRSERREDYLKLDPASDITVLAGEVYSVYSSRRTSSRTSRASRKES